MLMVIVGILAWWYTDGWHQAIRGVQSRLVGLFDYFSIDILLRTLFSPFRQISAGKIDGSIGDQLRAFGDQLISRLVGATARLIIMIFGLVAIIGAILFGLLYIVLWAFVPIFPLVGLVMTLIGWIPWTIL